MRLRIHNSDGDPVSGIPFTLTIDGPARFGNGSATVSGTSGDYTTVIAWHATGDGPGTVSGSVTLPSIDRIISSQDMVALGSGYVQALDEITVPVRTTFNPTIIGNGSATVSGTSGDYTTVITWHATGDGPVTVSGSVTLPSIDRIISSNDMVALGSGYVQALDEVTVPGRTTFNPTISTRTSPKSIDTGAPVTDDVQVSALPGSGAWPRGAQVHAGGWYFGGLPVSALEERYVPNAHATAPEFLEQLARAGDEACAFAEATFGASGQTVHVQGVREPRGAQVHARGWYFGGLPVSALGERYVPNAHATAPEFLEQLARAGYEP